jgi:lambda family phage tail tape measure protein
MPDTPDLPAMTAAVEDLDRVTARFGRTLTNSFASGVRSGKDFSAILDVLRDRLTALAFKAAFRPLGDLVASSLAGLGKALGSSLAGSFRPAAGAPLNILPNGLGNVFDRQGVRPFAAGGVVAQPTFFPFGRGVGLMGEKGAEAILPLARGPDGRLGVASHGGAAPVSVTVNIATTDVESFRRSEAQVAAALARAVARGRRGM